MTFTKKLATLSTQEISRKMKSLRTLIVEAKIPTTKPLHTINRIITLNKKIYKLIEMIFFSLIYKYNNYALSYNLKYLMQKLALLAVLIGVSYA